MYVIYTMPLPSNAALILQLSYRNRNGLRRFIGFVSRVFVVIDNYTKNMLFVAYVKLNVISYWSQNDNMRTVHNFVVLLCYSLATRVSEGSMPTYVISVWASCQIRKIAGCACAWNAGDVFPRRRLQRKLLVSDTGMHHGTCVTHVPSCMSVSLTRGGGENVLGIPGACALAIVRIWQKAHQNEATRESWCLKLKETELFDQ